MTVRTIKTNPTEAMLITEDKLSYIIRSDKMQIKETDVIKFQMYRNGKPVRSEIDKSAYVVTNVKDHMQTPIEKGLQIIAFRRLS